MMGFEARVYALTCQEAQTLNNVVTGTLVVENLTARVLFNPGATHSFIPIALTSNIEKPQKELTKMLLVSSLLGKVLLTDKIIEKCDIKIGEALTEIDLMILDLDDFDVILAIDWLSKYHAHVDCFHKIVTFQPEEKVDCIFQGEWIISPPSFMLGVKAEKMIKKGCMVWLVAPKVDEVKEEKNVSDVLVVKEYANIFPNDLLRLSPDREIK